MSQPFTAQELGLMRRYDTDGRRRLIIALIAAIADLNGDALAVAVETVEKLSKMSDAAFDALALPT